MVVCVVEIIGVAGHTDDCGAVIRGRASRREVESPDAGIRRRSSGGRCRRRRRRQRDGFHWGHMESLGSGSRVEDEVALERLEYRRRRGRVFADATELRIERGEILD